MYVLADDTVVKCVSTLLEILGRVGKGGAQDGVVSTLLEILVQPRRFRRPRAGSGACFNPS